MKNVVPVAIVVAALIAFWYVGAIFLNTPIQRDFFANTGSAWWVAGTGAYTINDWLSISGNLGHQWVNHTLPEYTHYDLGLTATYKSLSLDARYLGTDLGAAKCVAYTAGKKEWCSGGFSATLTYNIAAFPW